MDRIFQKPDIEEICTAAKKAITDTNDCIAAIRQTAAAISAAAGSVPAEAKTGDLAGTAGSLPGKLEKDNYDVAKQKLTACHEKACSVIPSFDSRYAEEMQEITAATRKIRKVIEELQEFMLETPLTTPKNEFAALLKAKETKWKKTLEGVEAVLDETLANVKGAGKISTLFSHDPVNLSTGNFIYDREDLKINGSTPFVFRRFYNSRNHYTGALGSDWNHNYEVSLSFKKSALSGEEEITILLEDGKEETFLPVEKGTYTPGNQSLSILKKTEKGYRYTTLSGEMYLFDEQGRYLRHEDNNGQGFTLVYEDHMPAAIEGTKEKETEEKKTAEGENTEEKESPAIPCTARCARPIRIQKDTGEYFALSYDEAGYLRSVTDHTGRVFAYEIKDGRLTEAVRPDGGAFAYAYDGNGKLSAVTNPRGIITVENEFDEDHRTTLQRFPDGTTMSYEYDDDKKTVTLTERNGAKTVHIHDGQYRNIKNIYPDGEESFAYNSRNQKVKITDKLGNETRLSYDNRGNLTGVINPLGTKLSITYESHNRPTNISLNGKEKQKNTFDGKGNLLEIENALGSKMIFKNNEMGLPVSIIQPDKSVISISYDKKGNITEYIDERKGRTQYIYDDLNRIIKVTDPNGNITHFTYDQADNIRTVTNGMGNIRTYEYNKSNKVTKIVDFNGSTIQRKYNVMDKPEVIIDQLGRETKLQYDSMWNLARITEPNGARTTYFYNENNHLSRIKDPNGNVKRYTYDGNGNRLSESDESGAVTYFSYDAAGRLIKAEGPDGMKYGYIYDAEDNLIEVEDALGGKITMKYDAAGQLIYEKNQMGESRYYTYNILGKVESIIDEAGRKTEYKYLPGGLLETVIHLGEIVEKYTYDANSNIKTYTNNEGFVLTYSYDSLNHITCIEGSGGEKNTYAYDVMGNIISMTDGLGNITKYEYTLTGRLSRVINPLNDVTEYAYDECDNLIEICQYGKKEDGEKECHITRYERDLLGYVRTITDPLGLKEHYKYDSKGQLLEKIDKEGYLTRYGYTSQGDINHIQYADGREVKLSYNPLRQLQELEDWLGTMKIETDLLGRAAKILYQDGKEVSYTYGKAGERTSITYPNGEKVFYNYNEDFRLSELKADNQVIKYEYDKAGRMIKKSFPNQMETAYCYNARGQIEQLAHMDKEGIIDKFTYQYDSLGNKTVVNKERRGMPEENGIYTYQYDPVGRVKSVAKNATVLKTYTYDAFGNRTKLVEEGTETLYTYNAVNQLVFKRDNSGETKYTFDKRGNLTQILENGNVKNQYYYGSVNRLERAINRDGETAQYRYNGMGYRIGKEVESVNSKRAIQYTIDLTKQYYNLLQKEDAENIQTYYWDGNVVGMFDHDMPRCSYYLQDEMGSPVRLAYANGDFLESYGYDEFGQDLYGNQGILQPFGYTGYQYDNIAETYFAQAREYDCKNGRFSSIDPYKGVLYKGDTINNYLYCINNPLLYFDPLGLAPAWLEGIFAHIQIELDLSIRQFSCEHTECNIRIPGAGLGKTGLGIADFLVDKGDRVEIYEIKPESWASGYRNRLAREQLDRYVSNYRINTGIRTTEGTQIFSNSLPYSMDPTRTLNYWSNGDGIIYYKIEPKPEPEPKRLPIAVPRNQYDYRLVMERSKENFPRRRKAPRHETLSGYQGNLETEISFIIIGKCIIAGVFTIGTIAEDVFTGGAGVADDIAIPATWAWALAP